MAAVWLSTTLQANTVDEVGLHRGPACMVCVHHGHPVRRSCCLVKQHCWYAGAEVLLHTVSKAQLLSAGCAGAGAAGPAAAKSAARGMIQASLANTDHMCCKLL